MKRALKHSPPPSIYHVVRGQHVEGAPPDVRGDLTDVRGALSGVRGNLSYVQGDLSGVQGDLSGVWGDLTDVSGNLDACELTDEDRKRGVDISELIERKSAGDKQ